MVVDIVAVEPIAGCRERRDTLVVISSASLVAIYDPKAVAKDSTGLGTVVGS